MEPFPENSVFLSPNFFYGREKQFIRVSIFVKKYLGKFIRKNLKLFQTKRVLYIPSLLAI